MSKVARGYLELLAGRNAGKTPLSVADEIRPTLDVHEFMASSQLLGTSGAATVGAIAPELQDTLTFTSTLGLKAIGVDYIQGAAAGTNLMLSVGYNPGGSSSNVPLGGVTIPALAAGQRWQYGIIIPNWIAPPGSFVIATVSGTAAGADHSLDVHAIIENYVSQV